MRQFVIKSNERSEYSYLGPADFFFWVFQEKVLKFVHAQFWFFAVWLVISFKVQYIFFVKRKANSTIEQQKCKSHEQLIDF